MSSKLLKGILSKTKTNWNSTNLLLNEALDNKYSLCNASMKNKLSCLKFVPISAQRNFSCNSFILSSHLPSSTLRLQNNICKKRFPQVVSRLLSSQRSASSKADNTDIIPGLGNKKSNFDGSAEKDGQNKQEGKDTWYSGKNAWKVGLAVLSLSGISALTAFIFTFGAPLVDPEGKKMKDEFSDMNPVIGYLRRGIREMRVMKKMIQDPSSEKLLPDELKEPWFQPPYTLVIEMTDILVHPDWTLSTGWRFKKRPGLAYFLQNVGPPLFEIVIYTHEQGFTAYPIIDSMDPEGRVMYRLFRDATKYVNGAHVKDLSFLNRDLSKVIMVDCDAKAMSLQPRNGLLMKKWTGDDSDRKLIDLANFLKTIALSEVGDVRGVMEHYSQFDDPLAVFKEKQKQLQQFEEEKAAKAIKSKPLLPSSLSRKF